MKTDDVVVSFRGVRKVCNDETLVIRRLDLDIYRGELFILPDPSGPGKTICLMMLAGFEFPTGGETRLEGTLFNNMPPRERNIGMMFQNYTLFPHMVATQDVECPLTIRKLPAVEYAERVHGVLQTIRMEGFAKRYPVQLSGGQQQRIALARVLMFELRLVLMDEPLGALNKQLREHMQYELKSLHEKLGATFVYVTHDQNEALAMSDHVVVFDKGVVQQFDAVDSLCERPCSEFVANFIGDSNMLCGTVTRVDGDYCELQLNDGTRVIGRNVAGANVGVTTTGCIHPEYVRLAEDASVVGDALVGQARDLIYFGGHVRIRYTLSSQPERFVKVPLGARALEGFALSAPIQLGLVPEHLCAFV